MKIYNREHELAETPRTKVENAGQKSKWRSREQEPDWLKAARLENNSLFSSC